VQLAPIETAGGKRLDIEGLRAVAIIAVVVYHAVSRWLPGGFVGVDVFFVISGFLITGQIWREVATTGRLRLARFWSRRAKRLLPATMVVLLACSAATLGALAITQRSTFGGDITAAAVYLVNWRLAARAVNYAAEGTGLSPVQHFWSLAVEEQFYILWPLLVGLVVFVIARRVARRRGALVIVISLVVVVSLAWSVALTARDQPMAFFVTQTRLWELGIGALGALALPLAAHLRAWLRTSMASVGAAMVLLANLVARESVAWPGYRALLPTVGTLAIVMAGSYPPGSGLRPHPVARALSIKPMVWMGAMSYSWYLWHWPAIIWARAVWPEARGLFYLGISVGSLIPAYVTHKLVENPIRFAPIFSKKPAVALGVGALCTAVGASAGLVTYQWNDWRAPDIATLPTPSPIEPDLLQRDWAAILAQRSYPVIVPDPTKAQDDLPLSYSNGCRQAYKDVEPVECLVGDLTSTTSIAVVGDSYMEHWEPAIDLAAQELGVQVVGYYKSGCPLTVAATLTEWGSGEIYPTCPDWGRAVVAKLVELDPAFVLTSHSSMLALSDPTDIASERTPEAMAEGVTALWRQLEAAGIPIVVMGRNPNGSTGYDTIFECVAQNPKQLDKCTFEPNTKVARWQQDLVESFGPGASYFDLNSLICAPDACPAVIDGVLVYRAGSHLTATFAETLASAMRDELAKHLVG